MYKYKYIDVLTIKNVSTILEIVYYIGLISQFLSYINNFMRKNITKMF